jgi:tetratricopeptide (TPR) repeat protein
MQAASYFQKVVPVDPEKWTKWSLHALYHLGWSYLKAANDLSLAVVLRQKYFDLAEESFKKLVNEERAYLALGQCYLSKASALNNVSFYQQAEELLSCRELFISSEAQMQALLLRAEAAPTFSARDKLYSELTLDRDSQSALISRSWYLKGINSFDYASSLFKENRPQESISFFQKAAIELKQAFYLMKDNEKKRAASALKLYAQACYFQNHTEARMEAFRACENLISTYGDLFEEMDQPAEIYYLRGLFAAQIFRLDHQEAFNTVAIASLNENLSLFSGNSHADAARYLLGFLHQEKKDYRKAREYFTFLVEQCPNSKYAGEALFAAALCSDNVGEREEGKKIRLSLLEKYPMCTRAADAYLTLYDFQEYLQGDKDALKHLEDFKDKYPSSPWLLNVNFLIGLDCKRDRKTASGKWIRQKNLKDAIDAFQAVETLFHQFQAQKRISEDAYPASLNLYYKAKLERALANLAIAEASQGAKKVIYSEYAINVFREIKSEVEENQHLEILAPDNPFPFFQEEYLFGLAQAYIKAGDKSAAEKEFKGMIEKYKGAKITRGYYLSRLWYEKGMLAQKEQLFEDAMHFFALAEDAGKGKVLTSEQKLSLWLEQSKCCQRLNQLDEAMLLLSKVINSDVASGLRLQAMFLRAKVYELQGRYELAMKQLETIVKKGGDWSFKAQKKLEEEYGIE